MMINDGSSPYRERFITVRTIYQDLINNFLFYLHISHSIIVKLSLQKTKPLLPEFILNFYMTKIYIRFLLTLNSGSGQYTM